MSAMPDRPTWEEVLADVEADLDRTERSLRTSSGRQSAADPDISPAPFADATDRLPARAQSGPDLPSLASMPPVPAHLADRILSMQDRIRDLEKQLRAELRALDELRAEHAGQAQRASRFATTTRVMAAVPTLFDSRV